MENKTGKLFKRFIFIAFLGSMIGYLLYSVVSCTDKKYDYVDLTEADFVQIREPDENAPKTIIHTDYGDITATLYPQFAPKTVANFVRLAESDYYDDSFIYRIEPTVFFAGGSQNPDGTIGSKYNVENERVEKEISSSLWPIKGALCACDSGSDSGFWKAFTNSEKYYTGSKFFICNTIEMTEEIKTELLASENRRPIGEVFIARGGIPNFSQEAAVFGQVTSGIEIAEDITNAETASDNGTIRPKNEIKIKGIDILNYDSESTSN
ncbi:MAG: peptidylprolyl isomerase [Ruminococcus sp.]|jgi:peptidyl-prolyl cis-trans isomerase B (cyclophilin B)|nr:peptidylprolyl isomerase [Ruminococcus sp.]